MPPVDTSEVKFWSRTGGRIEKGSMYQRRPEWKAVVARIWPLERMARFSNPIPLMLTTLCTGASGDADGGIEVTTG